MPTTTIARKGFGSQPDDLAVDTGAPVRRQQSGVDWTCGNGKGEPVVGSGRASTTSMLLGPDRLCPAGAQLDALSLSLSGAHR